MPATTLLLAIGRMICPMRRNQPIPWTRAVSSNDLSIWWSAAIPVRAVNGRFFTTVIRTSSAKVP
ncbi:hypothetical protein D3C83_230450 [compost metagenome]